jgi:hypothetical protein
MSLDSGDKDNMKDIDPIDIVTWNPITDEYGNIVASFYIKPTIALLDFLNRQYGNGNRAVMVQITDTQNPIYDGKPLLAIVDKSSDCVNGRQNFYDSTGLYVVTISVKWFGYPPKSGKVIFKEGILNGTDKNLTNAKTNFSDNVTKESFTYDHLNEDNEENDNEDNEENDNEDNEDNLKDELNQEKDDRIVEHFRSRKVDRKMIIKMILVMTVVLLLLILSGFLCGNGSDK